MKRSAIALLHYSSVLWLLVLACGCHPVEKRPGAPNEAGDYHAWVWVRLTAEWDQTKVYMVPGEVTSTAQEIGDGGSYYRFYFLHQVRWPSGGVSYFGEDEDSLELGKLVQVTDKEGRKWKIALTDKLAPPFTD